MHCLKKTITAAMCLLLLSFTGQGYSQSDPSLIQSRLKALEKSHGELCKLSVLCKTAGGMDVYVISIGTGERDSKPGIAILGGIDGRYIHTREMAVALAEEIAGRSSDPDIAKLLSEVTFYVFPDVSPDASSAYFTKPVAERRINVSETDDDRDFQSGEDGNEDLNGDGMITWVRIEDPAGTWMPSPDDPRLMIQADPAKGQRGSYIVVSEGYDNDDDGKFNEDGAGGTAFNANFTHNYEEFGLNSGPNAISEIETRAVADFLFDHFNIYMTVALGPQDNLSQPWKAASAPPARGKKPSGLMKGDEAAYKLASEVWKKNNAGRNDFTTANTPGNFAEWSYFDYGRYSFSTPAWQPAAGKGEDIAAAVLKGSANAADVFADWKEVPSDKFGGRKAEAGGMKPFVTLVPPDSVTRSLSASFSSFMVTLAAGHPAVALEGLKTERIDGNLWRVTVKVRNTGMFATCTEAGDRNKFVRRAQLSVSPAKGQQLVSGSMRQPLPRLDANQSEEYSWLITGKGELTISAGAVNCGISSLKTDLR